MKVSLIFNNDGTKLNLEPEGMEEDAILDTIRSCCGVKAEAVISRPDNFGGLYMPKQKIASLSITIYNRNKNEKEKETQNQV
jgi:hypothetical protein